MTTQRKSLQETLTSIIDARTPQAGDFDMPVAGLSFFRREAPARPVICMIEPSIVLVAQGVKQVWVGGKAYGYDPTRFLITSLEIPANSEVMVASDRQSVVKGKNVSVSVVHGGRCIVKKKTKKILIV